MSLVPPLLSDHSFATKTLRPTNSLDLERQCHTGTNQNKATWWRQIWRLLLSLVLKSETPMTTSTANGNFPSTPNTAINQPALESGIVAGAALVEPSTTNINHSTPIQPDWEKSGLEHEIAVSLPTRVPSTLPANNARLSCSTWRSSDTTEPWPDNVSDEEICSADLDDMISLIESADSLLAPPPTLSLDRSTARDVDLSGATQRLRCFQRESTTIPSFLYDPYQLRS
jgi:hypothetical protein